MKRLALVFVLLLAAGCIPYDEGTLPRVLVLGDSITDQAESRIRTRLDPWQIGVSAAGGDQTANHTPRTTEYAEGAPAVLVVALGTNDAQQDVPLETYAANVHELVDGIAPACTVVVTLSEMEWHDGYPAKAQALNAWLIAEADLEGWQVVRWDQLIAPEHTTDGVHLTSPDGRLAYADAIGAGVEGCAL